MGEYICAKHVTMMDVIMYNELSQVLFMNHLLLKNSKVYQQVSKYKAQEGKSDEDVEVGFITEVKLLNIEHWYTQSMRVGDPICLAIRKYDLQMRTQLSH